MTNQCPLVNWFKFETKCAIKRCKYYSDMLETGCIAIERSSQQRKELTDVELMYYKFNNKVPISKVLAHKKIVAMRVKHILILHKYIQYVNDLCYESLEYDSQFDSLLKAFPLKLKKLNVTPHVLVGILNEKHFKDFCTKNNIDSDVKLHSILMLSEKAFKDLLNNEEN